MPFDMFGNWVDDPTRAPADQQYNGNPWGQQGLQQAEQTIIRHMQQQMGGYAQTGVMAGHAAQAHEQHLAAHAQAVQQRLATPNIDNLLGVIEELSIIFRHGIRELVMDKHVYATLIAYFAMQRTYANHHIVPGATHLVLNLAGGSMIIRPEGSPTTSQIDFDKYMEEIDEHAP